MNLAYAALPLLTSLPVLSLDSKEADLKPSRFLLPNAPDEVGSKGLEFISSHSTVTSFGFMLVDYAPGQCWEGSLPL